MTTATWPVDLPCRPLRESLSATKQDNRVVFQPEVGDAKVRRRFTAVVKDFDAQFKVTPAQRDMLDTFFDDTLADGTLPFTWTDPQNGDTAVFRFLSPIEWSSRAPRFWLATCKIRRIP